MLVLVALAVLEELLWDALVFRDYLPALCRNMTAAPPAVEAATHGGLRLASRFGGRAFERSYEDDERSARRRDQSPSPSSPRQHAALHAFGWSCCRVPSTCSC